MIGNVRHNKVTVNIQYRNFLSRVHKLHIQFQLHINQRSFSMNRFSTARIILDNKHIIELAVPVMHFLTLSPSISPFYSSRESFFVLYLAFGSFGFFLVFLVFLKIPAFVFSSSFLQ